jgi:hypothetical protein
MKWSKDVQNAGFIAWYVEKTYGTFVKTKTDDLANGIQRNKSDLQNCTDIVYGNTKPIDLQHYMISVIRLNNLVFTITGFDLMLPGSWFDDQLKALSNFDYQRMVSILSDQNNLYVQKQDETMYKERVRLGIQMPFKQSEVNGMWRKFSNTNLWFWNEYDSPGHKHPDQPTPEHDAKASLKKVKMILMRKGE